MRLQRLLGILAILLRQRRVRAEYLATQFEVSVRTIYRDLETLEQAGVPLVTYQGTGGGIEIMDTYKLDKSVFLNEDLITLLSGLKSISGTLDPAIVNRTMAKLQALIPQNQTHIVELTGKKLYIDLKPWSIHPEFQPLFDKVRQAVDEDRLISFSYTDRESSATQRIAEPHQLVLKGQTWYLRAFCRNRADFRLFKLLRIRNVQLLEETFIPRPFSTELDEFKEWTNPKTINVEMIAHPSLHQLLLEYYNPESLSTLPDGRIHINLPFTESEAAYGLLLQMGHLCKVISPPAVIDELKNRIREFQKLYEC